MDEILLLLKSPVFWLGTVISSLLVNLLASYTLRWLDRQVPRLRDKRTAGRMAREEALLREIEMMSDPRDALTRMQHLLRGIDRKLDAGFYIACGASALLPVLVLPGWWTVPFGALAGYLIALGIAYKRGGDRATLIVENALAKVEQRGELDRKGGEEKGKDGEEVG